MAASVVFAGALLLACSSASRSPFSRSSGPFGNPVLEWQSLASALARERSSALEPRERSSALEPRAGSRALPADSLRVAASADNKALFSPAMGAREMQNAVKEILLPTPAPATTASARPPLFENLCHLDRMYVRVRRSLFTTKTAYKYLKLGSCPVNRGSPDHYYFLYLLQSPCGFSNESRTDIFAVTNDLHFNPPGPVVWEVPFDVSIECHYHRTHHVYSPGIHPQLKGGTVYKKLGAKASATIVPQDAAGNELTGTKTYNMGETMYFEVKFTGTQGAGQRLYANKCYMTPLQDPNSTPKYTVIDNQGCMLDGKITAQAKFLPQASKMSLKFSLGAFVFKDMMATPGAPKKIYMHCEIAPGPLTATESAKSCNYISSTKKWTDLYDGELVCACCDTSCSVQPRGSKRVYTSSPLEIDSSLALKSNFQSGNVDDHDEILGYSDEDYWKSG